MNHKLALKPIILWVRTLSLGLLDDRLKRGDQVPFMDRLRQAGLLTLIRAKGKAAGVLATDEAVAREFLSLGATFVAVGVDTMLLAQATQTLAQRFIGGVTAPEASY